MNEKNQNPLDAYSLTSKVFSDLLEITTDHLSINQETEIKTKSINLKYYRAIQNSLVSNISLENGNLKLPNMSQCNPSDPKCNPQPMMIQAFSLPKVLNTSNGDFLNISQSTTVSLSFYTEKKEKIKVENKGNFEILIKKDLNNFIIPEFKYINTTLNRSAFNSEKLIVNFLELENKNSSIHVQIKPAENLTTSYLVLIKFNEIPSLSKKKFEVFKALCPEDLIEDSFDIYYQVFSNMNNSIYYLKEKKWVLA